MPKYDPEVFNGPPVHDNPIDCDTWYDGCLCAELPHVVSALILNARGEMFLQKRPLDKSYPGKWEHPGGKVEPGENHAEALCRELREELRSDLTVWCWHVRSLVARYVDRGKYCVHLYEVLVDSELLEDCAGCWIAPSQALYRLDRMMPSMAVFGPATIKYLSSR
jgi:8-oxo-dGTP pyrophosphatase MutT (NUDIX family)